MAELTDEDIEFIQELREAREQGLINRRQALGLLAGVGIGGAAGALGTGAVKADASTSDSDGNVGLPGDRVDVFGEGGDFNSLDAEVAAITKTSGAAYNTSRQTISGSTPTKLELDAAAVEDASVVDVDLTNNQFVIGEDGTYMVAGFFTWVSSSNWTNGDLATVQIYVNGSKVLNSNSLKIGTGRETKPILAYVDTFTNGDTIDLRVYQTNGGTANVDYGSDITRPTVVRIG